MGRVNSELRKVDDATEDCASAVKLDDTCTKAYLRRTQGHVDTEQYEEAVPEHAKEYQMEKTKEHRRLLKSTQLQLKKSERQDYYTLQGVDTKMLLRMRSRKLIK